MLNVLRILGTGLQDGVRQWLVFLGGLKLKLQYARGDARNRFAQRVDVAHGPELS